MEAAMGLDLAAAYETSDTRRLHIAPQQIDIWIDADWVPGKYVGGSCQAMRHNPQEDVAED